MTNQATEGFLPEPGDIVDVQGRRFRVRSTNSELSCYMGLSPAELELTFYLSEIPREEINGDSLVLRGES